MRSPVALNITTATHPDDSTMCEESDRRGTPRFGVRFRTIMSGHSAMSEETGLVRDLSLAGCRVEAPVAVQKAVLMELRIFVPDLDWPIMIDGAVVQWVKGNAFGLHFVRLRPKENDRLSWVIARVAEETQQN